MKSNWLLFLLFNLCITCGAHSQTWTWGNSAGGLLTDQGNDLLVDALGNAYITGKFSGTTNFSGTVLNSNGGSDIFVAKYNNDGSLAWARSYGGALDDEGLDLALDKNENIVVLASFEREFRFGSMRAFSNGGKDIAIMKLNPGGTPLSLFTDGGVDDDLANYVVVDNSDNVIICGNALEGMQFGGVIFPADPTEEFFVLKYDNSGNKIWMEKSEDPQVYGGYIELSNIEVDDNDNIYINGNSLEAVEFAGLLIQISGLEETFVIKLDPDGNGLWFRDIDWGEDNHAMDMAVNGNGDVILTGSAGSDEVYFGEDIYGNILILDASKYGGLDDASYVVRYDTDGGLYWAKLASVRGGHVDVNDDLDIVVTGASLFSSSNYMEFYNEHGNMIWNKEMDLGASYNSKPDVGFDQNGDIIVMDTYEGSLNLDGIVLNAVGDDDVFLAKLETKSPCITGPVNLSADATANSAEIFWSDVENATHYQYDVINLQTRTLWAEGVTNEPYVKLNGLPASTHFNFRVRAICSGSSPVKELRFSTEPEETSTNLKTLYSNEEKVQITDRQFGVFPNPVGDELKLIIPSSKNSGNISLIDGVGNIILHVEAKDLIDSSIDVSSLSPGIYFIQYENESGLLTKKIIKN